MARSTTQKPTKKGSKTPSQPTRTPTQIELVPVETEETPSNSDSEDDDSEGLDDGVDEEGMKNLLKALGDDGLDELGQAELEALAGDDLDDDSDEDSEMEEDGTTEGQALVDGEEESAESDDAEDEDEEQADGSEKNADSEDEDIALDDVGSDNDVVPMQKVVIDNEDALERICDTIRLDPSMGWTETLVVSYPEIIDVDVDDDLNRELAFYKQALHGASAGRTLATKHKLPFTRPSDYFAEMVKSDAHMERIRQKLLDETATIKRGEEKKREREGKKFGKQVQMEKLKERERSKKDMEERLKGLKRKRKSGMDDGGGEDFEVAVEDAIADRPSKRSRGGGSHPKMSRNVRDSKFGFGGAGKRSKQNTRDSTEKFDFGTRGGGRAGSTGRGGRGGRSRGGGHGGRGGSRGAAKRPGKSRRMGARSK